VRAMILAAGRGLRMLPLSALRPKPALPVRGVPVIAHLLDLLARSGVDEVIVNLHHRAEPMREVALRACPPGIKLYFSDETQLLGTGGGIRLVSSFLRASETSLVVAGDMLLDTDLKGFVERHRGRGDAATLLLRSDPRSAEFGTIGIDAEGAVRRIGDSFDLGGVTAAGVFVGVRAFAARCFESLPERDGEFEDLRDWLAPLLERGARDIRAELLDPDAISWEPVGTMPEYLRVNLEPPAGSPAWSAPHPLAAGTALRPDLVIGRGARVEPGARIERAVIWEDEVVPADLDASDGVFAGGEFVPTTPPDEDPA